MAHHAARPRVPAPGAGQRPHTLGGAVRRHVPADHHRPRADRHDQPGGDGADHRPARRVPLLPRDGCRRRRAAGAAAALGRVPLRAVPARARHQLLPVGEASGVLSGPAPCRAGGGDLGDWRDLGRRPAPAHAAGVLRRPPAGSPSGSGRLARVVGTVPVAVDAARWRGADHRRGARRARRHDIPGGIHHRRPHRRGFDVAASGDRGDGSRRRPRWCGRRHRHVFGLCLARSAAVAVL